MTMWRGVAKVASVGVAAATTAFALQEQWPVRELLAKSPTFTAAQKKAFEEHFPITSHWDDCWDFRSPEHLVDQKLLDGARTEDERNKILEGSKATATRNIILIRHGQYQMETADKYLTSLGREQAVLLGKRLNASGVNWDSVIMSTMNRATETATIMLEQLPKHLKRSSCSLLEEGPPYPPEPETPHWRPSHHEFYDDAARIESAFRRHIHRASPKQKEDSYEVIVCHANVIRYFVCRALQFPPEGWLRMSLGHCSLTWLVIRPNGRVALRTLGDTGHLPADKVSFS